MRKLSFWYEDSTKSVASLVSMSRVSVNLLMYEAVISVESDITRTEQIHTIEVRDDGRPLDSLSHCLVGSSGQERVDHVAYARQ